ncbi:MAG: ParB/RepB/Spo0J family partition protein [Lachnospirales bacterium]
MEGFRFEKEIVNLRVEKIVPNKNQPRKYFDEDYLDELAQSIKENGILQPITVRIVDGEFELVSGERRLKACKRIGLSHIPTILIRTSNETSAILALIENLQRRDLNCFEEAESYLNLINLQNITQDELAKRIGKSQSSIANKIRLLKLSREARDFIVEKKLTERHGRAILNVTDTKVQLEILNEVYNKGLNVKRTEALVEKYLNLKDDEERKNQTHRSFKDISFLTLAIEEVLEFVNESKKIAEYKVNKEGDNYKILIDVNLG